jgi:hypothetical protein
MKLSEFRAHLVSNPSLELTFHLPDGDRVPAHAHITEAGRVDKSFIDCGGTVRSTATCSLQAWVADDTEHRITPAKLAGILNLAEPLFRGDDLDVEVEYEDCAITQFPVLNASTTESALVFHLGSKHTDCLAKELCTPQVPGTSGCTSESCCA